MIRCRSLLMLLFLIAIQNSISAQVDRSYYLPAGTTYDENIPTPKSVIGHEVGEWHVTHDRLVQYMYALAEKSDRVAIEEYGRTYEHRPLLLLTITAPDNHRNLSTIKQEHLKLTQSNVDGATSIQDQPAVVWLGHTVHGNEASGANSSLLTAYHFAAAQGPEIEKLLRETIILIDPAINPDGLNRFSSWTNSHRSQNLVTDPNNLEQNEHWPRGRTNHYWFDLNRDYIPVQLPESQGRIAKIHEWKPNIYTDHHEMGTNSTFFFQPGVPSRVHPLIPGENYRITERISKYFREGLDAIGSLYFYKERYDDYYPGRGPTYVDFNGGIAILFEQASARSHAQESVNGILHFHFAIRNQFTAALATVKAGHEMRNELLTYQKAYYDATAELAAKDPIKAYVFGSEQDPAKTWALAEIAHRHDISVYELKERIQAKDGTFAPGSSYVIPLQQDQHRLIHALFEIRNTFEDSLFYDVSAWTLPLAFNLPYTALDSRQFNERLVGEIADRAFPKGRLKGGRAGYAYLFEMTGYYAHRSLQRLHQAGIRAKVATKPFTGLDGKQFSSGTIMVPVKNQEVPEATIHELMETITEEDAVDVFGVSTGAVADGPPLGSNDLLLLSKPSVMIIAEGNLSGYEVGEAWHLLDTRFGMQVSLVSVDALERIGLARYNTIVCVDGNYNSIGKKAIDQLSAWVERGGTLIGFKGGAKWLADIGLSNGQFGYPPSPIGDDLSYHEYQNARGAQVIGGSIFKGHLDLAHPIGWGFQHEEVPLFKRGTLVLKNSKPRISNPLTYAREALWSGYVPEEKLPYISNSSAIAINTVGKGKVIGFVDNPNFRAFWYGTNKLFLNAVFFGSVIR